MSSITSANRLFGDDDRMPPPPSSRPIRSSQSLSIENCGICLDPLSNPRNIKVLPCNHRYHKICIRQWANQQQNCPLCRRHASYSAMNSSGFSLGNISLPQNFNFGAGALPHFSLFPSSQPLPFFDLPDPIEPIQEEIVIESFDDDMPLAQEAGGSARTPLLLECIAGITQNQREGSFDGVVKLKAAESARESTSADFIVVADVSGSMQQNGKVEQLKQTLNWLVDNLGNQHRMSLITFNDRARRLTPLTLMDTAGKANQTAKIQGIVADGGTNITRALDTAARVLDQRRTKNQVAIVMVITDGQDAQALEASQSALASIARVALSVFIGLGADHDATMLSRLSKNAHGEFAYCPGANDIAAIIGGFVFSTKKAAATGAKLLVEVAGRTVSETQFPLITEGQEHFTPFTTDMANNPHAKARLTYMAIGETVEKSIEITGQHRTRSARTATAQELLLINKHKNRDMASKALGQAAEFAEQRDFARARRTLEDAINRIINSISAADPLCVKLIEDCRKSLEGLRDERSYNQGGAAAAISAGLSHHGQSGMLSISPYATASASLGSQSASFSLGLQPKRK